MAPAAGLVHQNIATVERRPRRPPGQRVRPAQAGVPAAQSRRAFRRSYVRTSRLLELRRDRGRAHPQQLLGNHRTDVVDEGTAVSYDRFVWDHEDMLVVASRRQRGAGHVPDRLARGRQERLHERRVGQRPSADGVDRLDGDLLVTRPDRRRALRRRPRDARPDRRVGQGRHGRRRAHRAGHFDVRADADRPRDARPPVLLRRLRAEQRQGLRRRGAEQRQASQPERGPRQGRVLNGAERMRGWYTGDDGQARALDGQWPSAGQGFGRVNLDNSLYFSNDPTNNWYQDVWRGDAQAFGAGNGATRSVPAQRAGGSSAGRDARVDGCAEPPAGGHPGARQQPQPDRDRARRSHVRRQQHEQPHRSGRGRRRDDGRPGGGGQREHDRARARQRPCDRHVHGHGHRRERAPGTAGLRAGRERPHRHVHAGPCAAA